MNESYRQRLIYELKCSESSPNIHKDIALVVHNQQVETEECLKSITSCTENYSLMVWDNNSTPQTKTLLTSFAPNVFAESSQNLGFIKPNNYLARLSTSPYLILINSDVVVKPGWDKAMIGFLEANPKIGIVGYEGGLLDDNFCGVKQAWGNAIDYVCGWCLCIKRDLYKNELFDPNLKFAYGEDSDLSLRAKAAGYQIYALHLNLAMHKGGSTIKKVKTEIDVTTTFRQNHEYLKKKWKTLKLYHG